MTNRPDRRRRKKIAREHPTKPLRHALPPIRLTGREVVEITLQESPPVRVRVSLAKMQGRGTVIVVQGIDSRLMVFPGVSNEIFIDSDQWELSR